MSSLRKLSAIYIAAASAYSVAIACSHDPALAVKAKYTGAQALRIGGDVAIALDEHVIRPGWAIARVEGADLYRRIAQAMKPQPAQMAQSQAAPQAKTPPETNPVVAQRPAKRPVPHVIATQQPPALRPAITEPRVTAGATPPRPRVDLELAPQTTAPPQTTSSIPNPPAADNHQPSPAELARVSDRLRDSLTAEMLANFDLFLYVSKAESGPWAQRMYVFDKKADGNLVMLYNWPVSTGREKVEYNAAGLRLPSYTPTGYYELDPRRFYTHYNSIQWNQPMPYAMFFNWVHDGAKTGLAIHGATGSDIALLGTRASAGCVRLAPQNAQLLFNLIRNHYKGDVPLFDFDRRTATMANNGLLLHDASGHLEYAHGYRVLVFIENFGGENVVAALF